MRKGLNRDLIIQTATKVIETDGYGNFSMRLLADKLDVKTASLYTHIESMEALIAGVGSLSLNLQRQYLTSAIEGKHRDDAVLAIAGAYRRFAMEHKELYRLIMQIPIGTSDTLKEAAGIITEPIMAVLKDYHLSNERRLHWQRVLRAMMHGFISQEFYGYFSHFAVDAEESYRIAVKCLIAGLSYAEEAEHCGE